MPTLRTSRAGPCLSYQAARISTSTDYLLQGGTTLLLRA
jgi:hypothetical protein